MNQLAAVPEPLLHLEHLRSLDLSQNRIESVAAARLVILEQVTQDIARLASLQELRLDQNR